MGFAIRDFPDQFPGVGKEKNGTRSPEGFATAGSVILVDLVVEKFCPWPGSLIDDFRFLLTAINHGARHAIGDILQEHVPILYLCAPCGLAFVSLNVTPGHFHYPKLMSNFKSYVYCIGPPQDSDSFFALSSPVHLRYDPPCHLMRLFPVLPNFSLLLGSSVSSLDSRYIPLMRGMSRICARGLPRS